MGAPRLTIVVENAVRELDAKLLLAGVAAERGFAVTIGEKRALLSRLASGPPSVFLNKDVSARSTARMQRVQALGHTLAATDEEALVWFSPAHYLETKVAPASLAQPALLLAWGDENARVWRDHPACDARRVAVTGSPRVDLLRPELRGYWKPEADALRARLGPFVLVNTNFGQLNNRMPRRSGERRALDAEARAPGSVDAATLGLARHRQALFEAFQAAVAALARAMPEHTLVVRPHPSEDDAVWRRATAGLPNAVVAHEGNAAPWLLAAAAVVHNGCTTALEARLLGTPAVAFQPVEDARFDKHLPNALSHRARSVSALVALAAAAREGRLASDPGEEAEALLARHVAATTGALAAERIAEALWELARRAPPRPAPAGLRLREGLRDLRLRASRASARVLRPRLWRARARYYDPVFPSVPAPALRARLARLGAALGRFDEVELRGRGPRRFELRSRRTASW